MFGKDNLRVILGGERARVNAAMARAVYRGENGGK